MTSGSEGLLHFTCPVCLSSYAHVGLFPPYPNLQLRHPWAYRENDYFPASIPCSLVSGRSWWPRSLPSWWTGLWWLIHRKETPQMRTLFPTHKGRLFPFRFQWNKQYPLYQTQDNRNIIFLQRNIMIIAKIFFLIQFLVVRNHSRFLQSTF